MSPTLKDIFQGSLYSTLDNSPASRVFYSIHFVPVILLRSVVSFNLQRPGWNGDIQSITRSCIYARDYFFWRPIGVSHGIERCLVAGLQNVLYFFILNESFVCRLKTERDFIKSFIAPVSVLYSNSRSFLSFCVCWV